MSATSPRSNALTRPICVRMLARLKGLLPIPARPGKAGAESNRQASRRELFECCDGRSLSHRVAIARDQNGGAKLDALRLFGNARESDPYVVAEGGNLWAPNRSKAEVFC